MYYYILCIIYIYIYIYIYIHNVFCKSKLITAESSSLLRIMFVDSFVRVQYLHCNAMFIEQYNTRQVWHAMT